ncbi:MAG: CHRD domain-containing protein [Bacillota bacterium]|nr:CHRD domain-containing protein [Bacillota bacterium]
MNKRFFASLSGAEEVPPVETLAFGETTLQLNEEGTKLHYRLMVNNLQRFIEAHIHLGARGENGPIVAFLFGPASPSISVNRATVQGIITEDDLVGPLEGQPFSALIQQMLAGNTYVNVHTERHPAGEIRGQIRKVPN